MITTRYQVIYNNETKEEIIKEIRLLVKKIRITDENEPIQIKFKIEYI
jgi:hypothetical protein